MRPEKPKWKSDIPITEGQLRSRRDEFWDTAPAFEGHREIWDALRAAACALEGGDHQLAQAIIDGANISLPSGSLIDCYDELGIRYQLPPYVLSAPTNLIEDRANSELTTEDTPARPSRSRGVELPIRLQLSTGKELRLTVRSTDTVQLLKRQVQSLEGIGASRLRLFFAGRQLTDRMRIKDAKIRKHYTVQVIVAEPATCDTPQIPPIPPPPPAPLQLTTIVLALNEDS